MRDSKRREIGFKFFIIVAGALLSASACQHGAKSGKPASPAGTLEPKPIVLPKLPAPFPGVVQITQVGSNSQGRFAPDGAKAIFVSRGRPGHKHSQVYEIVFPQMTEHRLTFHDGDDVEPSLTSDGNHFYYASATDELKDETVATERLMRSYYPEGLKKGPPGRGLQGPELLTELYWQSLNGRELERLTSSPGLDGEVDIEPKVQKHILFTSNREGGMAIYTADAKAHGARRLTDGKGLDHAGRYSPDGKNVTWYRISADGKSAKVFIADAGLKNPRELVTGNGVNMDPTWHPNGSEIIFSSNREGRFYSLYLVDREGRCLRRLSSVEMDETHPDVSPDGKRILFTGTREGSSQLYMIDYIPTGPCTGPALDPVRPETSPSPIPSPIPSPSPSPVPTLAPSQDPSSGEKVH